MAGISNCAMRVLCTQLGADLAFAEMVSAKGLFYESSKTAKLLSPLPQEKEIGIQLFGHESKTIASQASKIEEMLGSKLAYIDINMGCPAKKIVSKGDGAALMKDPNLACEIVSEVRKHTNCYVTAKFRRGFEIGDETCVEFAKKLEDAGACAITVHGRFAEEMYRGSSNIECIKKVKQNVSIDVVGNGDVRCASDYFKMKEITGCDAVMIARAAMTNPLLFKTIKKSILKGEIDDEQPSINERMDIAIYNVELLEKMNSLKRYEDYRFFRRHAMCYVQGIPHACEARSKISQAKTPQDFIEIFKRIKNENFGSV